MLTELKLNDFLSNNYLRVFTAILQLAYILQVQRL